MNKGVLYMIISGLCFIVVNFFVKILGGVSSVEWFKDLQSYPAHELVLARSVVSFAISFIIIKQKRIPVFGNNKKWLIIRGVTGTIALTIFFYTIHYLPLAVAAIIQYLSPIFTILLAIVLLKERVRALQWIFIIISFIGVALIASSNLYETPIKGSELSYFWLGMGMLSAVFSALAYTSIVKLKDTDEPITIVMYFPMIAMPFMIIFCLFDFTVPIGIEWLYLLVIGLFTQFAQIMLTKALHNGAPSAIMPLQYLGAIYAFVLGYFIFDETLSLIIDIGMILVIFGVIANVILRNR
jgi:drug/metabolite transporter (DMT)-like permease